MSVIIGAEPTGHDWFGLGVYLRDKGLNLVLVNPYHVKRSQELDDNHPSKSDRKDPKTIAKLVIDGRYSKPYIPAGVYAELQLLLADYDAKIQQYEALMAMVEALCEQIPAVAALVKIAGVGLVTVAGVLAEVGDIRRFDSPRQIQKLAGLAVCENSSGKFRGQTTISKRGRSRLRAILFRAAIALAGKNPEFRELQQYYTTRTNNSLKKKQSIIALCYKLIRIFHVAATKGCAYNLVKMLADIHRNQLPKAA